MSALAFSAARPTLALRPYQLEAREAVAECWADTDRGHPMVVLPTGTGKTFFALSHVVDELESGGRVVWLAHRTELLDQPLGALAKSWPHLARHAGIVQAARDAADRRVIFASVQTLQNKRRREAILRHGAPTLVVVDEAHHSTAPSQRKVIEALGAPRLLGLTATPHREDGGDLGELWDIAYSYPLTRAIAEGWLVCPWAAIAPVPDLNPATLAGLSDEDMGQALIDAHVVEHTVDVLGQTHHATRLPGRDGSKLFETRGRRWLVFTGSVEQARLTAEALCAAGWRARWAHGGTSNEDRARLLRALGKGSIDVLCSPTIFTEGTDEPAVDGILLARAYSSWSLYVQSVGRGLRLFDPAWIGPGINALDPGYHGKTDCLVVDLVGATDVHDLRSAPVLIGGSKCPEALDGVHDFREQDDGKGLCALCEKQIPCFAALDAGETAHKWVDGEKRHCQHCHRPQCERSEDGRHAWQPLEDTQVCLDCGLEIKLRDRNLKLKRRDDRCREAADGLHDFEGGARECRLCGKPAASIDGAWMWVPDVTPETCVVDVGDHGLVFVRVDRAAGTCEPIWLRKSGRKPRPLSREPIPLSEARAWTDYLVRAAAKVSSLKAGWRQGPATEKQIQRLLELASEFAGEPWLDEARRVYRQRGPTAGDAANAITRIYARKRAIETGIAEPALIEQRRSA